MPGTEVRLNAGLLSFEVQTPDGRVRVFLSHSSWQASQGSACPPLELAQAIGSHRSVLDRIVRSKVRAGARSPVVLMARDLLAHGLDGAAPGHCRTRDANVPDRQARAEA